MIKVAIVGYGNLGRGVEIALKNNPDMELVGVFTRRDPKNVHTLGAETFYYSDLLNQSKEIDVCILCGGSATDLPIQTVELAQFYNLVDSYDNHGLIPEHFENVNNASLQYDHSVLISSGWDPGLFSINRLLGEAILPNGTSTTFWGKGVSQGHSDALRRLEGVQDAVQYTVPNEEVIERLRNHEVLELTTRDKHVRVCYVVLDGTLSEESVQEAIVTMPNYFADYDTSVNFISQDELNKNHKAMPHGGLVLRQGKMSDEHSAVMEFNLSLESNPEFTASVLVAYARAVYRMNQEGVKGALTVFDVAPKYLSPKSNEQLRKELL